MCDISETVRNVLSDYAKTNDIQNYKINSKEKKENNYMSETFKLELETHENNSVVRHSFVVKNLPKDEGYCDYFKCKIGFRNEHFVYQKLLPILQEYAAKPLVVPECIYSSEDCVILKDFGMEGYTNFDFQTGFTVERTKAILAELANLHAASLILANKNLVKLQEINGFVKEIIEWHENSTFYKSQQRTMDIAIKLLEAEQPNGANKAIGILHKLKPVIGNLMHKLLTHNSGLNVISHGDLWLSNILARNNAIKLIDLQLMRFASPAADLSYFFYVNLDPYFWRENKMEFLTYYREEVVKNARSRGVQLENEFTLSWLVEEMKQFSVFGFVYGLWIMPVFFRDLEMSRRKEGDVIEKYGEATASDVLRVMSRPHKDRMLKLIEVFLNEGSP